MGSTKVQQPSPPTAPTATASMSDYIANYPRLFELMQQYAPQEAGLQLSLAQQYAQPMGQAYRAAQEAMYPEEAAISSALNRQILSGMEGNVPDWMREEYLSNLSSQLGTNIGSPIGADYASRGLLQQKQDWQNYYRNLGLSITGRQPIATAQTPQFTNQLAAYTPQDVMSYNASTYSPYASAFANMYGTNAQMASQGNPWLNAGAGIVGMGLGGWMGNL